MLDATAPFVSCRSVRPLPHFPPVSAVRARAGRRGQAGGEGRGGDGVGRLLESQGLRHFSPVLDLRKMGDEEGGEGAPYTWTSLEPLAEGQEEAPTGKFVKSAGR